MPYGPLNVLFSHFGPHHRFQREKLLYWSDLAHSKYLGSSKCVLECAKFPPPLSQTPFCLPCQHLHGFDEFIGDVKKIRVIF